MNKRQQKKYDKKPKCIRCKSLLIETDKEKKEMYCTKCSLYQ